jgi:hypothetical protein
MTLPAISLPRQQQVLDGVMLLVAMLAPVAAGVIGLVAALEYVRSPGVIRPIFDDSYISLHFARNLAEHGKLTFDGTNWSTGATSPLHVALIALGIKYGGEPIMTGIVIGVASHVGLAVSVYALTWAIFRSMLGGLLAAAAISFTALAAVDAGNGLETSLFMALVTASMAAFFLARRWYSKLFAGVLIGLAILTRPEGAFLLPAVFIYRFIAREKGEPFLYFVRDALLLCGPGTAALAFIAGLSLAVNGSIGGTASAKLRFFQEDSQPFDEKLTIASDNVAIFLSSVITLVALGMAAARRREAALFALFWVPVLIFYTLLFPGGLTHYFYRYQHPVLPLIAVLAGAGGAILLQNAARGNLGVKLAVIAALIVVIVPFAYEYDRWRTVYRDASYETLVDMEGMVRDLNTIIGPGETLATHDIGAVAYFGNFNVLDLVGLVNPDVIPYHEDREVDKYIEGARPDYLLVFPEWDFYFLRLFPGSHPEKYELVKVYEGRNIRVLPYLLYRVKDDVSGPLTPVPNGAPSGEAAP